MKPLKTLLIGVVASSGAILAGVGVIHAAGLASGINPMNNLVNAIAQKFNLNASDVQQVFDVQRQQMQAARGQQFKTTLDQSVKEGKLTQDQEDKIIAKKKEVTDFMTTLQGKTPADRMTAMKTEMSAMAQWIKDNNIPQQYVRLGEFGHGGMRGGRHGMGGELGRGNDNDADDAITPAATTAPIATSSN